ncbi:DUF4097 family beta strand repeat-containing protein [Streptomyces xanthochromogenes]|uniref:DUF4097 family beta strand repeat-containing protein n=1 Tax=Streptomyces xanthochromogenes TaxID=67384 RepID=UPI00343DE48A
MKRPFRTKTAVYVMAAVVSGGLVSGCMGKTSTDSASYTVDSKVTSLKVKTSGGTIDVVAGSGNGVRVTESLKYDGDKPKTQHLTQGGELSLTAPSDCGGGLGGSTCEVDYRVEVPKALAATLESDGGNISVDKGVAGRLTARSDGGRVTAGFTEAPDSVDISSSGGNVTIRVPDGAYAVDAATGGGSQSVRVRTDPGSARKIRARSDGGGISVLPLA